MLIFGTRPEEETDIIIDGDVVATVKLLDIRGTHTRIGYIGPPTTIFVRKNAKNRETRESCNPHCNCSRVTNVIPSQSLDSSLKKEAIPRTDVRNVDAVDSAKPQDA